MNKLTRALNGLLAAALVLTASAVPALAASVDQDTAGDGLSTAFTYEYKNDPTYTVTIPESVTLSKSGTAVTITAEDVAYLDGQEVSVTIAGTNYFRNQLVLSGKTEDGKSSVMRYQVVLADGTVVETTGTDTATGTELASFTEDGSVSFTVMPVTLPSSVQGVTYTGSMTYGIALVDAE